MSDQSSFISQIKEEEAKAAKMLQEVETENDTRLSRASEEAEAMIKAAEEDERIKAVERLQKAKEEAKTTYSRLLVDADNARRDVVENGKTKVERAKSQVFEAFMAMFE